MVVTRRFRNTFRQVLLFLFVFAVLPATIWGSDVADPQEDPLVAARKAFERKDFRAVLGFVRQEANANPESVEAQQRLAYMAGLTGEAEEALRAYQKIVTLAPSLTSSYWLGKFAGDIGETSIAAEALQKTLSYSSSEGEATQAYRQHVAQSLFQVLMEAPDRKRALSLARSQGWVQEEIDYCKPPDTLRISRNTAGMLALLIHPERAECALKVGKDLTESGEYRLARFVLVDLIQNSKKSEIRRQAEHFIRHRLPSHDIAKRTEWLHLVGATLTNRPFQLLDEALEVFRKTIAADPRFAQGYYRIGYTYWEKNKHDEALSWLHGALSIQPDHWRATYGIGCVLSDQKKYKEALPYYKKAVELNPEDEGSYYKMGQAYLELEQFEQALPAYRKAVAVDPNDAYSRWGLSWVLHKLGREEEAAREWAMTLQLKPEIATKSRNAPESK